MPPTLPSILFPRASLLPQQVSVQLCRHEADLGGQVSMASEKHTIINENYLREQSLSGV